MARLIYSAIASVDGYVADSEGNFDWAEPDEEVHAFVNDLLRPVGTHLYGRRMYEVMVAWETIGLAQEPLARSRSAARPVPRVARVADSLAPLAKPAWGRPLQPTTRRSAAYPPAPEREGAEAALPLQGRCGEDPASVRAISPPARTGARVLPQRVLQPDGSRRAPRPEAAPEGL